MSARAVTQKADATNSARSVVLAFMFSLKLQLDCQPQLWFSTASERLADYKSETSEHDISEFVCFSQRNKQDQEWDDYNV